MKIKAKALKNSFQLIVKLSRPLVFDFKLFQPDFLFNKFVLQVFYKSSFKDKTFCLRHLRKLKMTLIKKLHAFKQIFPLVIITS